MLLLLLLSLCRNDIDDDNNSSLNPTLLAVRMAQIGDAPIGAPYSLTGGPSKGLLYVGVSRQVIGRTGGRS